jgi:flavin-dependent dehydrogenase
MIALNQQGLNKSFDVVILGAGFSGVLAALELPSHLKVALVDMGSEVIPVHCTCHEL